MNQTKDRDSCPGITKFHYSSDGILIRIRLPGGLITAPKLYILSNITNKLGSSVMELTSRGNIQIRAVVNIEAVIAYIKNISLLPSTTHDRSRNIVASPLSGRFGGTIDTRSLITDLDTIIQVDFDISKLSSRFWFSIDDGSNNVLSSKSDVGVYVKNSKVYILILKGHDTKIKFNYTNIINVIINTSKKFIKNQEKNCQITSLNYRLDFLKRLTNSRLFEINWLINKKPPVGWFEQRNGKIALGVALPLGLLHASVAQMFAIKGYSIIITPWHSIILCDLNPAVAYNFISKLESTEFILEETSYWLKVSSCTGIPRCSLSETDVRTDAIKILQSTLLKSLPKLVHNHFVGCKRACGSPLLGEVLITNDHNYLLYPAYEKINISVYKKN